MGNQPFSLDGRYRIPCQLRISLPATSVTKPLEKASRINRHHHRRRGSHGRFRARYRSPGSMRGSGDTPGRPLPAVHGKSSRVPTPTEIYLRWTQSGTHYSQLRDRGSQHRLNHWYRENQDCSR